MVDDNRLELKSNEKIFMQKIRFRTLGCYPLTGALESDADSLEKIIDETLGISSERASRVIDQEAFGSMERRKREGYF
ncbi:sulfate adenylyltransferase [Bacillus sp. OR9]|nr:sulfate adenylyltransferase [Bacillus sp. OR9]